MIEARGKGGSQHHSILVLPGDGIGPDVTSQAVKVATAVGSSIGVEFSFEEAVVGGAAIDQFGEPLPREALEKARSADAILFGAVGGPQWDSTDPKAPRPEQALLGLRKGLELFANLRPVKLLGPLADASSLKPEVVQGIDLIVVRELTGGIYFGDRARTRSGAYDTCEYSREEIERIARVAFDLARTRSRRVVSVDKANILETSRLWREVTETVAADYPDVALQHQLVDNASMQLIRHPRQFDVLLTENMFGDILSDEAAMLTGSIGMLPSASLGSNKSALYEPVHGSAPDIAGQDKANPIATILSVALMFSYSLGQKEAAQAIEQAVEDVLDEGYRTPDIWGEGASEIGTRHMGDLIAAKASDTLAGATVTG